MPIISAFGDRQKDCQKFKASLQYIVKFCLKTTQMSFNYSFQCPSSCEMYNLSLLQQDQYMSKVKSNMSYHIVKCASAAICNCAPCEQHWNNEFGWWQGRKGILSAAGCLLIQMSPAAILWKRGLGQAFSSPLKCISCLTPPCTGQQWCATLAA